MLVEITVDTEALVVDAYPEMKNIGLVSGTVFDVAWGFYRVMHKRHPEMMKAYEGRMLELIKAVQDIERSGNGDSQGWWSVEEWKDEGESK